MLNDRQIKEALYSHCLEYVNVRLQNIQTAMREAKESANDDSKSSAGDKHETGRSMAQLEQEKLSLQLLETEKLQLALSAIDSGKTSSVIAAGNVIITDNGNYFIAISAGKVLINNEFYFLISPASPIGRGFIQNKNSTALIFNNQKYNVKRFF